MTDTTRPHAESTPVGPIRGKSVGRYLLLDSIGRGGCGEVYRAFDPMLDRKVAIKVLHRQSSSDAEILQEGRVLARFSHPNVLPVFDVGVEDGRVFLAMEYVDAGDLRRWLDDTAPPHAIAALAGAARGLAAAHDAGIVHGDIKPANVLLGADQRLLISDFGIARAATIRALGSTEPERAGTPAYMAPELSSEAASAASDQYAFCIMAAAVVEGRRPIARIAAALKRGSSANPKERWPSMGALADVLERRDGKRSRWIAGVAALMVVGGATVASSRPTDACGGVTDPLRQHWDAEARAAVKQAITENDIPEPDHMWSRVESQLDVYVDALGRMRTSSCNAIAQRGTADETLQRREVCLDRAQFHLGTVVRTLQAPTPRVDRLLDGLPPLERCVSPTEALAPDAVSAEVSDAEELVTELNVALTAGHHAEAAKIYTTLRLRADALGYPPLLTHADHLGAWLYTETDRDEEALPLRERALARAIEHSLDRDTYRAATSLGYLLGHRLERHDEGLIYAQLGVQYAVRLGSSDVDEANARSVLASVLSSAGNTEAALQEMQRTLELYTNAHGENHHRVASAHADLSIDLRRMGRLKEAEVHRREAVKVKTALFGEAHPATLRSRTNLAALLPELGRPAEAEREARAVLELHREFGEPTVYDYMIVSMALAHALLEQERFAESVTVYREILGRVDPSRARHVHLRAIATRNLATALGNAGQPEEAEQVYAEALDQMSSTLPSTHPRVASVRASRASNLIECGRLDEARTQADLALNVLESAEGISDLELSEAACAVGVVAHRQGDADLARTQLRRCVELRRETGGAPLDEAQQALAELDRNE